MKPNPVLRELGFSDRDRVMIVHADDIGMCQAGVAALDGLVNSGVVSSLATMTVCPWFPAVADYYRAHPAMDLGLHFTVTSEWDVYRWGPISTRNPASGLLDEDGFFPKQSEPVQLRGKAAAVKAELEAQIQRAKAAGIDLTHVDSHMATVFHPKFLQTYLQTAAKAKLPPLWLRVDEAGAKALGVDGLEALAMTRLTGQLESRGMPLFDRIFVMPLDNPEERVATAQRAMAELPPGLSYFILHPACDTPELRAIAPDWKCRVADYQAFTGDALRDFVKNSGIHVIGWRPLRELMRRKAGRG
ncbi:MAG TPA: polysaccharide deacetylase family protein [Anaerolineales bacterium]